MFVVVLSDGKVGEDDFRFTKMNRLFVDLQSTRYDVNIIYPVDYGAIFSQVTDTVHIASFCADLKLVKPIIDDMAKYCSGRPTKMKFILIEDLVVTERPYIYTNYEANFFRGYFRLPSTYSWIEASTTNSNILRNSWGEGDTTLQQIPEIINESSDFWKLVKESVKFHEMFNQGNAVPRLISIQSLYSAAWQGRPLYRHPNDEEPPNEEMVPVVRELMALVERQCGVSGLNHVLIQHYRNGRDNIAAHSDKTLDIDLDTPIINLSLGSSRVMSIQNKTDRHIVEKIPLRHGECVVFGLRTNQFWVHEVPKDMAIAPHPEHHQERISFTFRRIATYITDNGIIVGQGSPYKTVADIPPPAGEESRIPPHTRSVLAALQRRHGAPAVA